MHQCFNYDTYSRKFEHLSDMVKKSKNKSLSSAKPIQASVKSPRLPASAQITCGWRHLYFQANQRCWQQIWRTLSQVYALQRCLEGYFRLTVRREEVFWLLLCRNKTKKCSFRRMNSLHASAALKFVAFMAALISVEGTLESENSSGLSTGSSYW